MSLEVSGCFFDGGSYQGFVVVGSCCNCVLLEVLVAFVVDCSTSGVCYSLCGGKITCVWLQVHVIPVWDKNSLCSV
jgi:hypothetical protein